MNDKDRFLAAIPRLVLVLGLQAVFAGLVMLVWTRYTPMEFIFEELMQPDLLRQIGRDGVQLAVGDLREYLASAWYWVLGISVVASLAWLAIALFGRVRTPREASAYRARWFICLAIGTVVLALVTLYLLYDHQDLTAIAKWEVGIAFVAGYGILYWLLGTLWLTPPLLVSSVPLGGWVDDFFERMR